MARAAVPKEVMVQMGHAMTELIRTAEWQIYEGYLLAQLEDKRTALESADMDEFLPLQGQCQGIRLSLSVPHLLIKEAKKEKKDHEDPYRFNPGSERPLPG